ncbi:MAG TPA: hypothetical protein VLM39_00145, partial [Ignavibacteriaceae bacterium]|nr:hypothetical protein [Ignavibacteriaceae bacterium]
MISNKDPNLQEISSPGNIKNMDWLDEFPFKSILTLKYLIEYWEKETQSNNKIRAALSKNVLDEVSKVPKIREPITDLSFIEKHKEIIDILMAIIYPSAQQEKQISASCIPFEFRTFYSSPQFKRILDPDGSFSLRSMNINEKHALFGKTLSAYRIILKEFYGIDLKSMHPVVACMNDIESGLPTYFNIVIDPMFTKPVSTGNLPKISDDELKKIISDPMNLKLWMEIIPP